MISWICVVTIIYAIFSAKADLHKLNSFQNDFRCQYAAGLTVGNRSTERECCERVVDDYYSLKRKSHNGYLSTFLESLQTWKCPQFQRECELRTFNYTDFTSLIYLRFCNRSQMENQCYNDIISIVTKQNNEVQITTSKFNSLVSKLNFITLSEEDLRKPCVQVAMYNSNSGSHSHYHEIIEPVIPFCSFVWCGFDENLFINKHVSPWTCMSSRCRFNLVFYLVANFCLALAIVVCNVTILGVLYLTKRDVQSIYRLTLAVADVLMGVVAIPIYIGTVYKGLIKSSQFAEMRNVTGYVITNDSSLPLQPVDVQLKKLNDFFSDKFLSSYVSATGFFTVLSLSVSVPTLVAASFDRFVAIFRPLRYNKQKAVSAAKIIVASVWFVAFILAILPIAIPSLDYSFVFFNIVSFGGKSIVKVYGIAYCIMVVLMWFSIIATYVAARPGVRRHDKQRQTDDEIRLLGTLGIMIAVFTLCVAPTAMILIISVYFPYVDFRNPIDFDADAATQFSSVDLSVGLVLTSNCLWNCFIYSIRETTFRSATKLLYKSIAQCLKLDQAWNLISRKT